MKDYEQALRDAERAVREHQIGEPLPQRLLRGNQIELYYGFPSLFNDYERFEEIVLNEIFLRVRSSAFGVNSQAHEVKDAREWLERAPLSSYKDYRPYIAASMNGERKTLYDDETVAYIVTSGTTGAPKTFAESAAGNYAKLLVMRLRGFFMRTAFPVTGDRSAKNLTFSNYANAGFAADGKPILRASGLTARNLRKYTDSMNIIPTEFWGVQSLDHHVRDYLIALMALADENLAKVYANNLAHFGRVLDLVDANAERMLEDLRTGAVPDGVPVGSEALVRQLMPPHRNRARDLSVILQEYGSLSSKEAISETWPRFTVVSGWLNGSTGRDARRLLRRLPKGTGAFDMGFGSSEGKWTIPLRSATAVGAACPFSSVYEFRDLRTGSLRYASEVEAKTFYELVVTTYSGLVRYNTNDVVYVDGFEGSTPLFSFCGKTTETITVNGKTRDSHNLQAFFAWLEQAKHLVFDLVQACVREGKLFFILESPQRLDWRRLLEDINEVIEPHWGMSAAGLYVVDARYEQFFFDCKEMPGRGVSGIKVPTVVDGLPDDRFVKLFVGC